MTEKVFKPDLAIDPLSSEELRVQLINQLRQQIETGRIPAGSKLPTIKEFARIYNIGENTVRGILQKLSNEGFIVKRRKLGTFVRDVSPSITIKQQGRLNIAVIFRMENNEDNRHSCLSAWEFDLIHYFEDLVGKQNFSVSLAAVNEQLKGITAADQLKIDNASGFLVMLKHNESQDVFVKQLELMNRPAVVCNYYEQFSGMRINEDWVWGTREIVTHLKELGHQRIAFCTMNYELPTEEAWIKEREDAFVSQATLLGLKVCQEDVIIPKKETTGKPLKDSDAGLSSGRQLFSNNCPYTALIAVNLKVAMGLAEAAAEENIRIPQDVSLVTYDDNDIALINGISTVMRDKLSDARDAARLLLENIANPTMKQVITIVNKPILVVRDSTAPLD